MQILFAFLLTLPFTQRWSAVTDFQRGVYLTVLMLVALSSALLIGPAVHHRLIFRQGAKAELVRLANRMALAGLGALGVAMSGVVLLVVDLVIGPLGASLVTVGTVATFGWLWLLSPARLRREHRMRLRLPTLGGPGPPAGPPADPPASS